MWSRPVPMSDEMSQKIEDVIKKVTDVIPDSFANAGESLDTGITLAVNEAKELYKKVTA